MHRRVKNIQILKFKHILLISISIKSSHISVGFRCTYTVKNYFGLLYFTDSYDYLLLFWYSRVFGLIYEA